MQADSVFSGISTFGRLPYHPCLSNHDVKYDIAFIGAPFDTATSYVHPGVEIRICQEIEAKPLFRYRPGARFGPSGIRQGSRRLNL